MISRTSCAQRQADASRGAAELRYFVTSIPAGTLTRDEELALVRMHGASRTTATG